MDDTTSDVLFPVPTETAKPVPGTAALQLAAPRLRRADRAQMLMRPCFLEDLLEPDHLARVVWALVCRWDLSLFLASIVARGETSGRAATDPKILICLWLYAYTQGMSNGRELDRLCQNHHAYQWICGGVSLNYHTLNDFRVDHEKAMDDLLTQMIGALLQADLISVDQISSDGTRQRAGAGKNSFKTAETLNQHLEEARVHVETLKKQAADPAMSAQRHAAIERVARQRQERLEKAVEEVKKIQEAKDNQKEKPSKHSPAKASETDPEARVMHFSDGGKRPGYNIQLAVATEGRAIVGVIVTNDGSDVKQSQPMREQVEERTGRKVEKHLMDGAYAGLESIDRSAAAGTTVYAPVSTSRNKAVDPHAPKKTDSEAVAEWRQRMATPEAKAIYKERASTVETANAETKTYRGLKPFLLRGMDKVLCSALLSVLAYNMVHFGRKLLS